MMRIQRTIDADFDVVGSTLAILVHAALDNNGDLPQKYRNEVPAIIFDAIERETQKVIETYPIVERIRLAICPDDLTPAEIAFLIQNCFDREGVIGSQIRAPFIGRARPETFNEIESETTRALSEIHKAAQDSMNVQEPGYPQ